MLGLTSNPGHVVTRHKFSAIFQKAWSKAMTMNNIIQAAGVYPLNRLAVGEKDKTRCESLAERTGLQFILLYSPFHQRKQTVTLVVTFDAEEMALIQTRFEEEYDLEDERYHCWLQMYHPDTRAGSSREHLSLPHATQCQHTSLQQPLAPLFFLA